MASPAAPVAVRRVRVPGRTVRRVRLPRPVRPRPVLRLCRVRRGPVVRPFPGRVPALVPVSPVPRWPLRPRPRLPRRLPPPPLVPPPAGPQPMRLPPSPRPSPARLRRPRAPRPGRLPHPRPSPRRPVLRRPRRCRVCGRDPRRASPPPSREPGPAASSPVRPPGPDSARRSPVPARGLVLRPAPVPGRARPSVRQKAARARVVAARCPVLVPARVRRQAVRSPRRPRVPAPPSRAPRRGRVGRSPARVPRVSATTRSASVPVPRRVPRPRAPVRRLPAMGRPAPAVPGPVPVRAVHARPSAPVRVAAVPAARGRARATCPRGRTPA